MVQIAGTFELWTRPLAFTFLDLLSYEAFDHVVLIAIHPSLEGHEQKPYAWHVGSHPRSLPSSLGASTKASSAEYSDITGSQPLGGHA